MSQLPRFAITPDQRDLDRAPRDLRFHPCTTERPRTLSRAQLELFNRDGFLAGLRVFGAEEADANRRYFDALLARVLAAGGDSYSLSTAHLRYGKVYDLLTEPRIVALVRDRIGPVAAFRTAVSVKRLPKTRSGKILRGTMQKIADGETWNMPATIDDPAILEEIGTALKGKTIR